MLYDFKEQLNAALKPWDSRITEIYAESGQFTAPNGTTYSGLPDFVRVLVESSCGEGSRIRHEIWLPENWNGCFVGTGNGGLAGDIVYPTLTLFVKMGPYAVAHTDMGTFDGEMRGVRNPDVHRDFGWRATYIMTVVGKLIARAYYKREIRYSYFVGRSSGGQQALSMAQRYPEEYDGIVSGVPAHNRTHLHMYFLWNYNALKKSGVTFSREELERVRESAVVFSKQNGWSEPEDTFVARPRTDAEHIDRFIDFLSRNNPELSCEKLALLQKIYTGPVNPRTGRRIYCGLPLGAELQPYGIWDMQCRDRCPYAYPFMWTFGADYDGADFDFDKDLDAVNQTLAADLNANTTDLSAFLKRGGKLFMYSGSVDACVPFPEAMKYYERIMDTVDAEANARDGIRYFLIPGQGHEAMMTRHGNAWMNGTAVVENNLDIIRIWREQGMAPDSFRLPVADAQGEIRQKTIYAYGTPENPRIGCPVCDETYLTGTVSHRDSQK